MPCECEKAVQEKIQSQVLWILLVINAVMFVLEVIAGLIANSSALLADSIDMMADAAVYGLALYAATKSTESKTRVAFGTGLLEGVLGLGVMVDVLRRWIFGSTPEGWTMIAVGIVAAAANVTCLVFLRRHRHGEAHIRATWVFTRTDVLANLGTVIGGLLVAATGKAYPDLIVGTIICLIILQGSGQILWESRRSE